MKEFKIWILICVLYCCFVGGTLLASGWGMLMASLICGMFLCAYFSFGAVLLYRDLCKRKRK